MSDSLDEFIDDAPVPAPAEVFRKRTLWIIHMKKQGIGAIRGAKEGFVCVGWKESGDLRKLGVASKIGRTIARDNPERVQSTITKWTNEAITFSTKMKLGHLVVYPIDGGGDVMIGQVSGEYQYRGDDAELMAADSANTLPVQWVLSAPLLAFKEETRKELGYRFLIRQADHLTNEVMALVGPLAPK